MKKSTFVVRELVSPFSAAGVGRQGMTHRDVDDASDLLKRLFRSFNGSFALRLWNGTPLRLGKAGPDQPDPPFTLVFRNPSVVRSMVLGRDRLRLAEAYFRGDIDIEGDFFAALSLKDHLNSIRLSFSERLGAVFSAFLLQASDEARPGSGSQRSSLHGRAMLEFAWARLLHPSSSCIDAAQRGRACTMLQ